MIKRQQIYRNDYLYGWQRTLHHSITVNVACDLQIIKRLDFREYAETVFFFFLHTCTLNILNIVFNISDLNLSFEMKYRRKYPLRGKLDDLYFDILRRFQIFLNKSIFFFLLQWNIDSSRLNEVGQIQYKCSW